MVKLHDGREIEIDVYKITHREWLRFGEKGTPEEEENEIIAKATGIKAEDVPNLPQPDYDQVVRAIFKTRNDLISNPT